MAEHSKALRLLLKEANEYNAELAADAAAAEEAEKAAAAEKAARIEAANTPDTVEAATAKEPARGKKKKKSSGLAKRLRRKGGAKSGIHPTKSCPICLDPLGTEGGIQALGCMDAFCRVCIASPSFVEALVPCL